MNHSKKIIYNTFALYCKIAVNIIVSIFSTRIALQYLGVDDFGLYNLVAGIISMLGFLNGSLMISTQRFLSIGIGKNNIDELSSIFNVSMFLHLSLGVIILLLLLSAENFFINHFINISPDSIDDAHVIYKIMTVSTIITLITNPYSSLINAHEDMWLFAISEIVAILLKLAACIALIFIHDELIITYSWLMLASVLSGVMTKYLWSRRYRECKIIVNKMRNIPLAKEMLGYVGWTTFGTIANLCRQQGIPIILNFFFGVVINAGMGIANQVNTVVQTFSTTITTVFSPSIIQCQGRGDESRMKELAVLTNKIAFLMSCLLALPIIAFRDTILSVWLTAVPEHTANLCSYILISFLITQFTPGINRAIYAVGRIRGYQLSISFFYLINLVIGYIVLQHVGIPESVFMVTILIQIIITGITLYFGEKDAGIKALPIVSKFIIPAVIILIPFILFPLLLIESRINIFIATIYSVALDAVFFIVYAFAIFSREERRELISKIRNN